MLSYMLPVEDKPPPVPSKTHLQLQLEQQHQQRSLTNGRGVAVSACSKTPTISSESSVSSFSSSEVTSSTASQSTITPTDKPKPKLIINGTKHHVPLKRVSFGSSKGSMVETLIYESPLQEEPEASPILENCCPFPSDSESAESEPSKRVRVTFYESEKPLAVTSPDPSELLLLDAAGPPSAATMTSPSPATEAAPPYDRQNSTDSGWDNPFRPDGDLSREADQIVELIKGGKPITPTPGSTAPKLPSVSDEHQVDGARVPDAAARGSPPLLLQQPQPQQKAPGANGAAPCTEDKAKAAAMATPQSGAVAPVEVKRETVVPASDASQVEHVVLKKKPKCKCCVIQ